MFTQDTPFQFDLTIKRHDKDEAPSRLTRTYAAHSFEWGVEPHKGDTIELEGFAVKVEESIPLNGKTLLKVTFDCKEVGYLTKEEQDAQFASMHHHYMHHNFG